MPANRTFDESYLFTRLALQSFVTQHQLASLRTRERPQIHAMEPLLAYRHWIAAGNEELGALGGLHEESEKLGGDGIAEFRSRRREYVLKIVQHQKQAVTAKDGLQPGQAHLVGCFGVAEIASQGGQLLSWMAPKRRGDFTRNLRDIPGSSDRSHGPTAIGHALHDSPGEGAFAHAACTQNLAPGFAAGAAERLRIVGQHADDLAGFATAADEIADFEHRHGAARRSGRRLGHRNLLDGAIEDGLLFAAQEQGRGGIFGYPRGIGQRLRTGLAALFEMAPRQRQGPACEGLFGPRQFFVKPARQFGGIIIGHRGLHGQDTGHAAVEKALGEAARFMVIPSAVARGQHDQGRRMARVADSRGEFPGLNRNRVTVLIFQLQDGLVAMPGKMEHMIAKFS
nr:hypothetical protein [uncultured bacterium]